MADSDPRRSDPQRHDPQLRCADSDRERVITELREHFATGRITMEEFDQRSDAANQAKTFGDLAALTTDLPAVAPEPVEQPKRRRPAFNGAVWGSWATVGAVCVAIWLLTVISNGQLVYFWPMWVIGPWGAMILAGVLSGRRGRSGGCEGASDREERVERLHERQQRRIEQHHRRAELRFDRMHGRRDRHNPGAAR